MTSSYHNKILYFTIIFILPPWTFVCASNGITTNGMIYGYETQQNQSIYLRMQDLIWKTTTTSCTTNSWKHNHQQPTFVVDDFPSLIIERW